ncbi:MAG: sulfate/molybdate ABC transporter ATP-binding protein [Limnochordia bacterium]
MGIEVCCVSKRFGRFVALDNVSLRVPVGELTALLGPSGSGKTTLLRIIAGLESPDTGRLLFDGRDATARSARERRVGFVFQHYALFRHMSVFENIAFGLRVRPRRQRPSQGEIGRKVNNLLRLVQLEGMAERYPAQLSGGQRQRVALARALAIEPRVLLLDEPFGALDAKVRQELRRWLRRLHDEIQITSLFVTHDQEEALEVADRVVIMNEGRIEQVGSPEQVYEQPANPFVCQFLGSVNLFQGRLDKGRFCWGTGGAETNGSIDDDSVSKETSQKAAVGYVRPHDIELRREPVHDSLQVSVQHVRCVGPVVHVELCHEVTGEILEAQLSKEEYHRLDLKVGETVFARPRHLRVFKAGSAEGRREGRWRELIPSVP